MKPLPLVGGFVIIPLAVVVGREHQSEQLERLIWNVDIGFMFFVNYFCGYHFSPFYIRSCIKS